MPITIDKTPAGLLATLAKSTGANQGRQQRKLQSNAYAMRNAEMALQDSQFTRSLDARAEESALDRAFRQSLAGQQEALTLKRDASHRTFQLDQQELINERYDAQTTAANDRARLQEANRALAGMAGSYTSENGYTIDQQAKARRIIQGTQAALASGRYDAAQQQELIAKKMDELALIEPTQPKAPTVEEQVQSQTYTMDGIVYKKNPDGSLDWRPAVDPNEKEAKAAYDVKKLSAETRTKAWDQAMKSFAPGEPIDMTEAYRRAEAAMKFINGEAPPNNDGRSDQSRRALEAVEAERRKAARQSQQMDAVEAGKTRAAEQGFAITEAARKAITSGRADISPEDAGQIMNDIGRIESALNSGAITHEIIMKLSMLEDAMQGAN